MTKPTDDEILRLNKYFAISSNNELWSLSESDLNDDEKKRMLTVAFSSLFHWSQVGTQENTQLANLAVARALCVNGSVLSVDFAESAFDHFDGNGADWIQAFTNAVLSHAYLIVGEKTKSVAHYERALNYQLALSAGDKAVFEATFKNIPDPKR